MLDEPEVTGLLGLLLLIESRRPTPNRADGSFVSLGAQDRSLWDRALIDEGQQLVRRCLRRGQPGVYQLQAAINAVHAAPSASARVHGPEAALALVDHLDLGDCYPFHATRTDLLRRLGRINEAAVAFERAAALAPTDAERDFLRRGGRGA